MPVFAAEQQSWPATKKPLAKLNVASPAGLNAQRDRAVVARRSRGEEGNA